MPPNVIITKILATGGTTFAVYAGEEFITNVTFGDLDDDGQYIETDDEAINGVLDLLNFQPGNTEYVRDAGLKYIS